MKIIYKDGHMWTSARRIRNCTLSVTPLLTLWHRPSSACIRRI